MTEQAHDTPADVSATKGDVSVRGPGGIVYSMTPDAAAETSDRLLNGATQAQGQRLEQKRRDERRDR